MSFPDDNDDLFGAPELVTAKEDTKKSRRIKSDERTTKVALRKPSFDNIPSSVADEESQTVASSHSLEENLQRLELIVERIESAEIGLEESITLYVEGTKLGQSCLKRLSKLEQRINLIRQVNNGELEQTPFMLDES